jgi:hypothetical protein
MRRAIGLALMAICIAALLAYNIHPPEGEDTNLLVRSVATAVTGGGAFLAWKFLVQKNRT